MELKQRKRIKNILPGFSDGKPAINQNTMNLKIQNPMDSNNTNNQSSLGGGRGTTPSSAAGAGPWFALGEWAGSGVGSGINSIQNESDLRMNAGTSYGTINGLAYQKENEINQSQAIRDYGKEMGMSWLTNPFKAVTMAIGRKRQRENIELARLQQDATNKVNRAGASTDYLEMEYSKKYGNPQDQFLYAKNGKDAVQTSEGEYKMIPNSKTQGQEIMFNADKESSHIIPGSPKTGDSHLTYTKPSDTILSRMYGIADSAAPFAKALEFANMHENTKNRGALGKATDKFVKKQTVPVLQNYADIQSIMRQIGLLPQTKMNKFGIGKDGFWHWDNEPAYPAEPFKPIGLQPSTKPIAYSEQKGPLAPEVYDEIPYDGSKYASKPPKDERDRRRRFPSNWWIDGLGALTSTGQLIADALQKRKTSNTYFPNPYARNSLSGLLGLRINQFPILKSIYDKERQNKYEINRAGGLSGAQKNYANIATGIATQNAIASALANIQKQNNEYRSSALHAALNAGQADRQARMAANQWDLDYYSKSHAAKHGMVQQDLYNMLAALRQGYKNSFERYIFDNTMDLYTT